MALSEATSDLNEKKEKYRGDGPEVSIQKSQSPDAASFRWLGRDARGSTYTSYTQISNRPGCSFDFGSDGYTASCNLGGELLQFTVPSTSENKITGLLTARADVDDSLSSIVALAQRYRGNKSTFGLKFVSIGATGKGKEKHKFVLGRVVERGAINNRWPFHEYALVQENKKDIETGTCALFSFVQHGVLHQVMRIEPSCRPGAKTCVLLPEGSVISLQLRLPSKWKKLEYPLNQAPNPFSDGCCDFRVSWVGPGAPLQEIGLDPKNPDRETLDKPTRTSSGSILVPIKEAQLNKDVPIVLILSLRLREKSAACQEPLPELTSESVHDWIGCDPASDWATGPMWETIFFRRESLTNCVSELCEVNLVSRCLEKIQHVDAVLLPRGEQDEVRPLALISNTIFGAELDMQALL
ncbi:hypothetical protein MMYC01_210572 [Madurella mycetomatis]|uniref:Uncharacterized protein n=1 Tax=Madurella mycetomatis TaxID=100816 RepID=A0A175VPH2_9PEZI|nr:hypothetical protein MMYC01_210572 [Madurella mycetomatis]